VIFAQTRRAAPALLCVLLSGACATPPRPAPETLTLAANARATVEGRVTDRQGRPVAAIRVQALPRGKDAGWSAPTAVTDSEGRFRLSLIAPAEYGFLLSWQSRTVITPEKDDPARINVAVRPGENRAGIELLFLREEWEKLP
jgi:protocatechuate 3,4-dioxygenase beta subunit